MKLYMTLCHAIKRSNIKLLCYTLREICIIMQAPTTSKPKYALVLLKQLHIINTEVTDSILQEMYLANALVNP